MPGEGLGLQTAAGVPLMCDEPADFKTFRIGLFGLDKLANIERTPAAVCRPRPSKVLLLCRPASSV